MINYNNNVLLTEAPDEQLSACISSIRTGPLRPWLTAPSIMSSWFMEAFADVRRSVAQFMAISQVPISAAIFDVKATVAAWSSKPSYAVIATENREINPEMERFMSGRAKSQAIELCGSHASFLSHPKEVASLIEKAAKAADQSHPSPS